MSLDSTLPVDRVRTLEFALAGKVIFPVLAACIGATLIALTNGDARPLVAIWPLLAIALGLSWVAGGGVPYATLAGFAMFGVSVLVAGVSHAYETAQFGNVIVGSDEIQIWYGIVQDGFSRPSPQVNAPLAIFIWRCAFAISPALGFGNDVWIGTSINGLVMAITAALILRMSAIVFPGDARRAARVAALTLTAPMFWMFGGLFIRDAFAVLIQAGAILAVLNYMAGPMTLWRTLLHLVVMYGLTEATRGIRVEMVVIFPVIIAIAAFGLALQSGGLRRPGVLAMVLLGCVAGGALVLSQFVFTLTSSQEAYLNVITNLDLGGSGLGSRLVVSQPLPIRAVTGTLYMHVFPIPVWSGFTLLNWDYYWLKSFGAMWLIGVTPFAAVGFWRSITVALAGKPRTATRFFLAVYWPVMVMAVAVTSLETRHLGQFMPALILLAVMPELRRLNDRWLFSGLASGWYGAVFAGHLLWLFVA